MIYRPLTVAFIAFVLSACQGPPSGAEVEQMRGFSWVYQDELAAMPKPRKVDDFEYLGTTPIVTLVSLTIEPLDHEDLAQHGIASEHIPVKDFTAPSLEQMNQFVELVAAHRSRGEGIGVHCTAGLGRSGTMLAANFVADGMSAADAIAEIRRLRPGSIETAEQEASIHEFAASQSSDSSE